MEETDCFGGLVIDDLGLDSKLIIKLYTVWSMSTSSNKSQIL